MKRSREQAVDELEDRIWKLMQSRWAKRLNSPTLEASKRVPFTLDIVPTRTQVSRGKTFIVEGYDVRDLQEKEAGIEAVGRLVDRAPTLTVTSNPSRCRTAPTSIKVDMPALVALGIIEDADAGSATEPGSRTAPANPTTVPIRDRSAVALLSAVDGIDDAQIAARVAHVAMDIARGGHPLGCEGKPDSCRAVGAVLASWLRMMRQGRVYERELSAVALSDSKMLERSLETPFIRLVAATVDSAEGESEWETLETLGIMHTTREVRLGGEVKIMLKGTELRVSPISGAIVDCGEIATLSFHGLRAVVVIENKANYHAALRFRIPGLLCVYGGGYGDEATLSLLRALDAMSRPEGNPFPIAAWSDIDLGGFGIVGRYREACPRIETVMMDTDTLEHARGQDALASLESHGTDYEKALRRWIAANAGSEFAEQAEWCLRNNGTVEQEVLIRGWSEDRLRELVAPR